MENSNQTKMKEYAELFNFSVFSLFFCIMLWGRGGILIAVFLDYFLRRSCESIKITYMYKFTNFVFVLCWNCAIVINVSLTSCFTRGAVRYISEFLHVVWLCVGGVYEKTLNNRLSNLLFRLPKSNGVWRVSAIS